MWLERYQKRFKEVGPCLIDCDLNVIDPFHECGGCWDCEFLEYRDGKEICTEGCYEAEIEYDDLWFGCDCKR